MIYQGTVVKIVEFGAFVNFFGSRDGLVHVSQLAPQRVANVKDVVKEGDKVWVKFMGIGRARQGAPVDEGRRPADRPGDQAGRREAKPPPEPRWPFGSRRKGALGALFAVDRTQALAASAASPVPRSIRSSCSSGIGGAK